MITVVGTVRAAAAGTGKAALYRRWSNKGDLVADAICHALPTPADVAVHGDVREDILALLTLLREAALLGQSAALQLGTATPDQNSAIFHDVIRERTSQPALQMIVDVLRQGVQRGQGRIQRSPRVPAPVVRSTMPARNLVSKTVKTPWPGVRSCRRG